MYGMQYLAICLCINETCAAKLRSGQKPYRKFNNFALDLSLLVILPLLLSISVTIAMVLYCLKKESNE